MAVFTAIRKCQCRASVAGLLCFFFVSCAAYAQLPVGIGIKGGVSFTDAYGHSGPSPFGTYSDAKDYIFGPFVELRLPRGFGVELDALYRPVNLVYFPRTGTGTTGRYATFEFPILAKYRFHTPILKPVIEAGPSFRKHGNGASDLSVGGFTIGGGVEFKVSLLHLTSDLRYTRWSTGSNLTTSPNLNQVELLFGIGF